METVYKEQSLKSGVYKIYNKLNGRIYIGSAKEFKSRYKGHIYSLRNNKHSNKFLQNDFNKCGEENFVFEVLEVVAGDKLIRTNREKELIAIYHDNCKNCYNQQKDPTSKERSCFSKTPESTAKKRSENAKKLWSNPKYKENISKKIKEFYSIEENKKERLHINILSRSKPEYREKLSVSHKKLAIEQGRNEPITQWTKTGQFVNEFISINEAANITKIPQSNINYCCLGKRNSAGGFIWKYINKEKPINKKKYKKIKSIVQYLTNGTMVNIFKSASDAARNINKNGAHTNIINCCKGASKSAYGFVWRYKGETNV